MIPGLDGLRAIAFFMVYAFHAGYLDFGWLGVQLFFVLSGFLITGILLDMKDKFPGRDFFARFYGRRILRIFPVYYVYLLAFGLAISILIDYQLIERNVKLIAFREQIPYALTYLYDFFYATNAAKHTPMLSHFWSLSVEEQFYLIWPLLIFLTPKRHLKKLFFAALIFGPAARALTLLAYNAASAIVSLRGPDAVIFFLPWNYMDAFAFGALLTQIKLPKPRLQFLALLILVPAARIGWGMLHGFSLAAMQDIPSGFASIWEYSLMNYFFAVLLYCVAFGGFFNRLLELRPIRYLGKISYGLYIFHNPILYLLKEYSGLNQIGVAIVGIALTLAVAMISFKYMEQPLLGFKDKLFPRNTLDR